MHGRRSLESGLDKTSILLEGAMFVDRNYTKLLDRGNLARELGYGQWRLLSSDKNIRSSDVQQKEPNRI